MEIWLEENSVSIFFAGMCANEMQCAHTHTDSDYSGIFTMLKMSNTN